MKSDNNCLINVVSSAQIAKKKKKASFKRVAIPKTIEYIKRVTRIVLNGGKCNAQYGHSIKAPPCG